MPKPKKTPKVLCIISSREKIPRRQTSCEVSINIDKTIPTNTILCILLSFILNNGNKIPNGTNNNILKIIKCISATARAAELVFNALRYEANIYNSIPYMPCLVREKMVIVKIMAIYPSNAMKLNSFL